MQAANKPVERDANATANVHVDIRAARGVRASAHTGDAISLEQGLGAERGTRLWTPERVPLTLPLAGLGERALAYGVDLAVLIVALLGALFVYNFWGDLEADLAQLGRLGFTLLVASFALLLLAYDVLCETLLGGRTPGKRLLKLRVVDQHGRAPDLTTSLVRNLSRVVDFLPVFYGIGTIALFFTGTRRLGDLLAGTVVLSERARERDPLALCRALVGDNVLPAAPSWNDADALRALEILERTRELPGPAAEKLCARVLARLDEERHRAAAATTPTRHRFALAAGCLALAEQRTGVVAQVARMTSAEDALREALSDVARTPSSSSVERLDDALRRAGSELMRGTRRGVPSGVLESLSLALLDAERARVLPKRKRSLLRFLARDVPAAVYRERVQVVRTGAVLATAAVTGFALCYADPTLGRALIGDDLASSIEQGARWTDEIAERGLFAQAALQIILNNAWVCVVAFLSGVSGGVLPLLVLFVNGVHLGSIFGYATRLDTADTLARFVLAHGPVELSALCVAGAAGLCLGRALLAPRRRTRLEALREEAATGGKLLVAALVAILVIGTVEGFVSPGSSLPWIVNLVVGVAMFALFFGWIRVLGGPAARAKGSA